MNRFEALHNMGAFTEGMFNRIIAFQEREHPAWNPLLAFAYRIQDLPLHNLIFSNPDRDPKKCGPTVAAYYPLREEMRKIAHYARQVAAQPLLCDLYPGNGFIGSLIGREGVRVVGLRQTQGKPNQIESFYDADCYTWSEQGVSQLHPDAVLVSWPPSGANPSPELAALGVKLLVYIYTDHVDPASGLRQTGSADLLAALAADYREIDAWQVERPKDLLHEIWPDLTPSIEELRQVRVYAHRSVPQIEAVRSLSPAQPYDWERELEMALLALQAKREVRARGFPT